MNEQAKIEIRSRDVQFFGPLIGSQHLFIIYKDSKNQQFIIRGGPQNDNMLSDDLKIITSLYNKDNEKLFPNDLVENNPRVTIATGTDTEMEVIINKMLKRAEEINAGNFDYKLPIPLCPPRLCHVQNSNTAVAEMVKAAGLELKLPEINGEPVSAPGINGDIRTTLGDKIVMNMINNIEAVKINLSVKIEELQKNVQKLDCYLCDPLVIDIGGNGIELTSIKEQNIYFNFDNDLVRERSAWIGKDNAFIITLPNSSVNKTISISEMIISLEQLKNYSPEQLLVWQDKNSNARAESEELYSLSELGIKEISLTQSSINENVKDSIITARGNYTNSHNQIMEIAEISIGYDNFDTTIYSKDVGATIKLHHFFLPQFRGYGNLLPLYIAYSLSEELEKAASNLYNNTNIYSNYYDRINNFLIAWKNASKCNNYDNLKYEYIGDKILENWQIEFLICFIGNNYENNYRFSMDKLTKNWVVLEEILFIKILMQTMLEELFPNAGYDYASDEIIFEKKDIDNFIEEAKKNEPPDRIEKSYYWMLISKVTEFYKDQFNINNNHPINSIFLPYIFQYQDEQINNNYNKLGDFKFYFALTSTQIDIRANYGQSNILLGNKQNNNYIGSQNSDIYMWGTGLGNDTIFEYSFYEERPDIIRIMPPVTSQEIDFVGDPLGKDLIIKIISTNEELKIRDFVSGYYQNRVEYIDFSDGTRIIPGNGINFTTKGVQHLTASYYADIIYLECENSIINGRGGGDKFIVKFCPDTINKIINFDRNKDIIDLSRIDKNFNYNMIIAKEISNGYGFYNDYLLYLPHNQTLHFVETGELAKSNFLFAEDFLCNYADFV